MLNTHQAKQKNMNDLIALNAETIIQLLNDNSNKLDM